MENPQKHYTEQERRTTQSYKAKLKIEAIKKSTEYKKAVQSALGDGVKRRPSERGQIKNQILQKFLHGV